MASTDAHSSAPAVAFAAADFFMVRAPILPADVFTHVTDTDLSVPANRGEDPRSLQRRRADTRKRLRDLASDPRVNQALHIASTSLSGELARLDDRSISERHRDRMFSSLLRYVSRMSSRATPLGLFAGVGLGSFAEHTSLQLEADPVGRTRSRSDIAWLTDLLNRLEADPVLRDGLPVLPNALLQRRAGRALLNVDGTAADPATRQVSVRLTGPVELALQLAEEEVTYGRLVAKLQEQYENVGETRIRALVSQLWELRLLLGARSGPMAAAPVESQVAQLLAGSVAGGAVAAGLLETRDLADAVDAACGSAPQGMLQRLAEHQRELNPRFDGPVYQTDTALALLGKNLSAEIAEAAAEAGELAMRLKCTRPRLPSVVEYHQVFLERYGAGSEIPLLEALSEEIGIGPPNDYRYPPRAAPLPRSPEPTHPRRDQAVVEMVSNALHRRSREVELTDALVERLTVWPPPGADAVAFPSMDIYAKLAAKSRQAIDSGLWRLVLAPIAFLGLQSFGRFVDLLDGDAVEMLRRFARAEEALHPDVLIAELNSAPWVPRHGNLMVRPAIREYEVCVNARPSLPPERRIPPSDIVLGATGQGFYLRSVRLRRRLVVTRSHGVTALQAPNLCRALLELSTDAFAQPSSFDWGPMSDAPFLPRLVRGKLVLNTAQWTLTPSSFAPDGLPTDRDEFFDRLQRWRSDWCIPRHVHLALADNRLLLDLDHPSCVDELHRELRRAGTAGRPESLRLQEMLPDFPELWLRDRNGRRYHSELVIPLRSTVRPKPRAALSAFPAPPPAGRVEVLTRRWLPGDEWVYLKLYTAESQQNDLIAGPLREFLAQASRDGLIDRWFYLRYADPFPHLRLRFRSTDARAMELLTRSATWAKRLVAGARASDFAFTSYDRELERYGGPEAIDAVEDVFRANSEVTADLLRLLATIPDLDSEVAGVVAMHSLCRSWGADPANYATAGDDRSGSARKRFRALRPLLCELLAPGEIRPDPKAMALGTVLNGLMDHQHEAVAAAGKIVRALDGDGALHGTETRILESLIHMQVNRLSGINRDRERQLSELWALALRAIANRPPLPRRGDDLQR